MKVTVCSLTSEQAWPVSPSQCSLGDSSSNIINKVVQQTVPCAGPRAAPATARPEGGGGDLGQVVDAREEVTDLVGGGWESVLEEATVVIVEVVEEETGVTRALRVLLATTAGAPSICVTEDGCSDEGIGSHVAQAKVLHQPDGLAMHSGLSLPSFLPKR